MESRRIFYKDGSHDEIPLAEIIEDGDHLEFMVVRQESLRVLVSDILCIEDR